MCLRTIAYLEKQTRFDKREAIVIYAAGVSVVSHSSEIIITSTCWRFWLAELLMKHSFVYIRMIKADNLPLKTIVSPSYIPRMKAVLKGLGP